MIQPTLLISLSLPLIASASHREYRAADHEELANAKRAAMPNMHHPMAEHYPIRRQASSAPVAGTSAAASGSAPAAITQSFSFSLMSTNPTAIPLTSINSAAPSAPTQGIDTTFQQGATPTVVSGAPALPAVSLNIASYPPLDKVPDTNSPEVQQWIQEVQSSGVSIPGFSQTVAGGCPANAQAVADTSRCWWTCTGCVRNSDITTCPDKNTWGLTYDDGPSPYTPDLLKYLDEQQLKSTFFVIGSRVLSLPQYVQSEYMEGHQISVHTWSHPQLTTLTNEQIIAELGWTKKIIKDLLGVTPNTMRPPFGDIDDRVRAICLAMGLTPIIWTRVSQFVTLDTDDFNIHGGLSTADEVLFNWQNILGNVSQLNTGFIVLEHDLFQQSVEIATGYILPDAISRNQFKIMPVTTCLNKPMSDSYIETNNNNTNPPIGPSNSAAVTLSSGAPGSAQATGQSDTKSAAVRSADSISTMMVSVWSGVLAMVVVRRTVIV